MLICAEGPTPRLIVFPTEIVRNTYSRKAGSKFFKDFPELHEYTFMFYKAVK